MLSCREMTELVTDYLEGRMPLGTRVRFRLHIVMCDRCRTYVKQMKATIRTLGRVPSEPLPPDVEEAMLRRFRNWKGRDGGCDAGPDDRSG